MVEKDLDEEVQFHFLLWKAIWIAGCSILWRSYSNELLRRTNLHLKPKTALQIIFLSSHIFDVNYIKLYLKYQTGINGSFFFPLLQAPFENRWA